jgi:hypothetical protein
MNILLKKYVRIFSLIVGILVVLLMASIWCVELFYKDKLVKYAISQINQQINARITITKSDFAFWKTFPNASVEFDNVVVRSLIKSDNLLSVNTNHTDTLLVSNKVYFQFNLIKLLNKNYVLKRILINDGRLYLTNFADGRSNFDILKKQTQGAVTPKIDLKSIVLKNCSLRFIHENSQLDINAYTGKTLIIGEIQDRIIRLDVETDLQVASLNVKGKNYLRDKNLAIKTWVNIENNATYTFDHSSFVLSDIPFKFNLTYSTKPYSYIRLSVNEAEAKLDELISVLPSSLKHKLDPYKIKGKCGLQFSINGRTSTTFPPKSELKFQVRNGYFEERLSRIELSGLTLDVTYSNYKSNGQYGSYLKIHKCNSKIGSGNFRISGVLDDLSKPKVNINVSTQLKLNELKSFLKLDTLEIFEGTIKSDLLVTGELGKLNELGMADTKNLNYKGTVDINQAAVKIRNIDYYVHDINGLVTLDNDIYFNNLSLFLHDNQITVNGKMVNGLPYLFRLTNETLVEADLSAFNIDLSKYFIKGQTQSTGSYSRGLLFPGNISFNLKVNIDEFKLNKFKAKWIKGDLSYKPGMFIIKSASFETCEGKVVGNGAILQDLHKDFLVKGQLEITKVNIRQMAHTFNNFAQTVVREEHLNGKLSGKVNFSSVWNNRLEFKPDMLVVDADVTIYNGELVNFKPLLGLSKFVAVDELQNVKFSTLHNNIFIKDKQIIIPQMDIQSSAFNISGSGVHNFDNQYNYKIRVLLSDLLYGKAKRAKKENEEFGRIEDDGLGKTSLYLNIEGKGSTYKISYDSRKTIDVVKESLTNQKKELKQIFREEFGWFKKDSSLIQKPSNSRALQVEWEDSVPKKQKKAVEKKNKKKVSGEKIQVEWE